MSRWLKALSILNIAIIAWLVLLITLYIQEDNDPLSHQPEGGWWLLIIGMFFLISAGIAQLPVLIGFYNGTKAIGRGSIHSVADKLFLAPLLLSVIISLFFPIPFVGVILAVFLGVTGYRKGCRERVNL